eukprot:TRINITY_DN8404_c0_g1_i1.p1 TRINITY_DN8404_c0_g1~~TRINITY_DN8404_c0_g1_i1.p1  ORF type:complete len:552 (+),score=166.34 TRINITY_DN8404_c0_g1_i1:159-1814(+)
MDRKRPRPVDRIDGEDEDMLAKEDSGRFQAPTERMIDVDAQPVEALSERSARRLLIELQKRYHANLEARALHSEPEEYIDSEVDLDEFIRECSVLSTQPELYPILFKMDAISLLMQLLQHDNVDIIVDTIDLIHELLDVDEKTDLPDALLHHDLFDYLASCLPQLNESAEDEQKGVHTILSIMETMNDYVPNCGESALLKGSLSRWLIERLLNHEEIDANFLYASEMLNVFLRESSKLQEYLGKIDGIRWIMRPEDDITASKSEDANEKNKEIGVVDQSVREDQTCIGMDALLIVLSRFRKRDPSSGEEMEAMENIFDCICCLLLHQENKHIFREMEGFELLLLLIRTRKKCRMSAVKMLDYALTQSHENCEYFVHISGLKILFPVFMKMRLKKGDLDNEEHVLSSLFQLFENMDSEKLFYTRLIAKFEENEFEKTNKLLDMWNAFRDRFSLWEHENEDRMMMLDDDEALMERISNGLLPLQMLAMMLIRVCYHSKDVREHVRKKFESLNLSWKMLAAASEDYGKQFGEEGSKEREMVEANLIKMIAELYE